jgi:hypothetical protein
MCRLRSTTSAVVDDAHPVGERLRLDEVLRAEQDRSVAETPHLPDAEAA